VAALTLMAAGCGPDERYAMTVLDNRLVCRLDTASGELVCGHPWPEKHRDPVAPWLVVPPGPLQSLEPPSGSN
jgi:hypothetical protein